ncbi:hypothetical protein GS966_27640 [Rhodococcus hoagii]|nr:hypothetical protein [Prescottella equi]NKS10240.1 hypothetical protein [Prescottella equi]NKS35231.1 hypothetical protein [Prescottella equi]NKS62078.1 hypothetical protein [Prescottella equi]NKS68252.1 hypothetical protein [Prescottella equi]
MSDNADPDQQKWIAAYEFAAAEAAAWAEVRDSRLPGAVNVCRNELGMSARAVASKLGVPRATLTRNAWSERRPAPMADTLSHRARELEDEVFIRVGLGAQASPQAQFTAGLISEYERDSLLDYDRRRQMQIPDQIHETVEKFPGIGNLELPRMIVMAVPKGTVPDLRPHAAAARCAVDGDDRWWLTKNIADLQPGDRIPRHLGQFEHEKNYEWVTVLSVTLDNQLDSRWTVEFQTKDGPEKWRDCGWDEEQPVR